jgi:hypothetical protein
MRTLAVILFGLITLYFSVTSCTNNKLPEPAIPTACDSLQVTFSGHVNPIIQQNCAISGCHVAGGDGNGVFTTYAPIKAHVDAGRFRHSVLEGNSPVMPPTGQLPAEQLRILECWVNNGAPNN